MKQQIRATRAEIRKLRGLLCGICVNPADTSVLDNYFDTVTGELKVRITAESFDLYINEIGDAMMNMQNIEESEKQRILDFLENNDSNKKCN